MWVQAMVNKKNKLLFAALAVIIIVIVAAATSFYLTLQSMSQPFSFSLSVSQQSGAVVKGGNTTISVETAYLNGTSHPLTLSASGGPNGTTYNFTPQTVEPTKSKSFSSNLTVNVPPDAVSRTYALNITAATADGTSNQTTYTLIVLDSDDVHVTGHVTANRWPGVYPTKIAFINVNTQQIFIALVDAASGSQTGTYNITLPNHQTYQIICSCNFTPASGHSLLRGFEPIWLTVDCAPGVTTLTKDFTDKDAGFV